MPERVSAEDAALLVERDQDEFVRAVVEAGADPGLTATRVCNDLAADDWSKVTPEGFAALIAMETSGQVTATQAKQVLAEMVEGGGDPGLRRREPRLPGHGRRRPGRDRRPGDRGQSRRNGSGFARATTPTARNCPGSSSVR